MTDVPAASFAAFDDAIAVVGDDDAVIAALLSATVDQLAASIEYDSSDASHLNP